MTGRETPFEEGMGDGEAAAEDGDSVYATLFDMLRTFEENEEQNLISPEYVIGFMTGYKNFHAQKAEAVKCEKPKKSWPKGQTFRPASGGHTASSAYQDSVAIDRHLNRDPGSLS